MILIKITLEATPEQLEQFSSLSYCVAMDHQYDYQPAYIEQYVHALKLSLECFMAANQAFELEFILNDFFFGNQIQHNMQTNLPNIALVHPKMTLKKRSQTQQCLASFKSTFTSATTCFYFCTISTGNA